MGLSLSLLISSCKEIFRNMIIGSIDNVSTVNLGSLSFSRMDGKMTVRTLSFKKDDPETVSNSDECDHKGSRAVMEKSLSFKKWEPENPKQLKEPQNPKQLKTALSFKNLVQDSQNFVFSPSTNGKQGMRGPKPTISLPEPTASFSPRPVSELDAAAVKLQKVYKSYRTRRNLADCAVVVEELWWKAIDFATLRRSSVSFYNDDKPETAVSRWARARTRVAKVGKGLSKDEKALKLALQHWLEAIDPRHRYGNNLHFYYDIWFHSESTQPFFYWLDVGDGKEVNVEKCPRTNLQRQRIKYLGPKERKVYEVVVESGKLVYRQSGIFVNTAADSKWIFVLSTSRSLYVGKKEKGVFQHSSFLAGGAITAAGRMVAQEGVLDAIWPYSGHYRPTEENFQEFISFLEEHGVDLANVKKSAIDDDIYLYKSNTADSSKPVEVVTATAPSADSEPAEVRKPLKEIVPTTPHRERMESDASTVKVPAFEFAQRLSQKWSTGAGPRIGIVRDYPSDLQNMALEHVNLSPRVTPGAYRNNLPIPSPRPSPKIRLSPRISYIGLPSPREIPVAN